MELHPITNKRRLPQLFETARVLSEALALREVLRGSSSIIIKLFTNLEISELPLKKLLINNSVSATLKDIYSGKLTFPFPFIHLVGIKFIIMLFKHFYAFNALYAPTFAVHCNIKKQTNNKFYAVKLFILFTLFTLFT